MNFMFLLEIFGNGGAKEIRLLALYEIITF